MDSNKVKCDQFGHWLRAKSRRKEGLAYKDNRLGKEQVDNRENLNLEIVSKVNEVRGDSLRASSDDGGRNGSSIGGSDKTGETRKDLGLEEGDVEKLTK